MPADYYKMDDIDKRGVMLRRSAEKQVDDQIPEANNRMVKTRSQETCLVGAEEL
jgi:hypothetical protein